MPWGHYYVRHVLRKGIYVDDTATFNAPFLITQAFSFNVISNIKTYFRTVLPENQLEFMAQVPAHGTNPQTRTEGSHISCRAHSRKYKKNEMFNFRIIHHGSSSKSQSRPTYPQPSSLLAPSPPQLSLGILQT